MAKRAGTDSRMSEALTCGTAAGPGFFSKPMPLLWSMAARVLPNHVSRNLRRGAGTPSRSQAALPGRQAWQSPAISRVTCSGAMSFGDNASNTLSSLSLSEISTTFSQSRQIAKAALPLQAP